MRVDRWRRRLLVAVGALLLAEGGTRLWDAGVGGTGSLYDLVIDAQSRFKLAPSTTINVPERYGTVRYSLNRQGYRDRDHDPYSRQTRILLLGDSVTFGLGVAQDAIYAAVLQRELDTRPAGCEVVNEAVFAYHSGHELAALQEDGIALRPRLVVLQFYMNDLAHPEPRVQASPTPQPTFGQRLLAAKNRYLNRSALWRRLRQAVTRSAYLLLHDVRRIHFADTLNASEPRDKLAYLNNHPDDASVPAFSSIRAMRAIANSQGARFLLLVTPDETQLFTTRYDEINRRIGRFCTRNAIHCLDVLPILRRAGRPEKLYLDGVHLSPLGHRLVGHHLAERLRTVELAPSP
jgi:lysophospholipase L1-like esterase